MTVELPAQEQTPDLASVIRRAIWRALRGVRVALPGRVESYDRATQRASVKPLVTDGFFDEGGARQSEGLPVITDVPVAFQGSGAYSQTHPIAVGDGVLLVFSSSAIDRWLVRGGEVDPVDDRHHHLSDAIAIPGLRDFAHAILGVPDDAWTISAPLIRLGGPGADEFVALKKDLQVLRNALVTGTISTGPGGAAGVVTVADTLATGASGSWPESSQKVKAE